LNKLGIARSTDPLPDAQKGVPLTASLALPTGATPSIQGMAARSSMGSLGKGKWRALMSGFFLRPGFLFEGQGKAAAFGVVLGSIVLSLVAMTIAVRILPTEFRSNPGLEVILPALVPWIVNLVLFRNFQTQRAFWGAWLLVAVWLVFSVILGLGLFLWLSPFIGVNAGVAVMLGLPVVCLLYAIIMSRRVR
jgi:hypothetical protein